MRLLPFILLVFALKLNSQVDRIEPPNWWIGMENPNLEIMLYGKDIGYLKPETKAKGVKIREFSCPENKNYLFIELNFSSGCQPGPVPINLMKGEEIATTINYPLKSRMLDSQKRLGYNSSDVIYLITPDRFANGDPKNDNVDGMLEVSNRKSKDGRHGGDIEGIRQHLDYIEELGVTSIWINPLLENNMPAYSYHGYAITDFYKVDPRMGNNEAFKKLCDDAHTWGLKVIIDGILNHCGSMHWWMKDPPTRDWINYYDQPYVETNHRKTLEQDPYAAPEDLEILEKGWFVKTMPDLNVTNPKLATYLVQNTIWWMEYSGADGIRMDTYLYPEQNFSTAWSKAIMAEYPNINITGEVWHEQPSILSYWQKGKENTNKYKSHLPSLFDFPLQAALNKSLTTDNSWGQGWIYLYETLALDFEYPNPNNLVVFADNHDMSRIYAQLGESAAKVKLAMAYILTIRGIPEIYYGTEVLMSSPRSRDDGKARGDLPGGWNGDLINAFTGKGLSAEQKAMQQYLIKILKWRKGASAVQSGKTLHYVPEKGIYVYFRYNDEQKIMVVLNKNEEAQKLDPNRFKKTIDISTKGIEIISGKSISLDGPFQVPAMSAMIIECK